MKRAMCLAATVAMACGATPRRGEDLFESIRTYHEAVRWERFPAAASRIPGPERDTFIVERDRLAEDLRITDYEVVRITSGDEHAEVQVKYTWYKDSEGIVRRTHAVEGWERSGKVWVLVDEHRVSGEEMPGLEDAPDAASGKTAAAAGVKAGTAGTARTDSGDAPAPASDPTP